jgi:glycosyltransferase involved in cell wall biosynthesis
MAPPKSDKKRLRIGYLTTDLSSSGGWGRYSRSLAEAVSAHADVVALTSPLYSNDTTLAEVHVALPKPSFGVRAQIQTGLAVWRHLRSCDVIHCLVEAYAPAATFMGILYGIPVTMTLHGTYAVPPVRPSWKRFIMRAMYRRMPVTTTGSTYTEQKAREQAPLGECRFIPNGVNLEKFRRLPGVPKEHLILTVGMLKARKGADITITAFEKLLGEYPEAKLVLVAEDGHDAFSKKVHDMAETPILKGKVTFLEWIADEELVMLYNRASVFTLPARSDEGAFEGFPMCFYEANACGTPVVTTGGFGSEYAIKPGKNGLLVPQDDPEALAEAFKTILRDPVLAERMETAGKREAAEHTWEKIAIKLISLYNDVIAKW